MKYCIEQIVKNIDVQINDSTTDKILIKVDGFETPELYFELWTSIKSLVKDSEFELTFKLCDEKHAEFSKLAKHQFYLTELKDNDLLANGKKLTNYRNEISEHKALIVLVGTEISEESGSLADFYTINIQSIEDELKGNYADLFLKFKFSSADFDKAINKLYKELFLYVPKNLYKLSCLIDAIDAVYDDGEELIHDIFAKLYEDWGFVNIIEKKPSFKELNGNKKIKILQLGDRFLRRKDFDKKETIVKNEKRIDAFIEEQRNEGIVWPSSYDIQSYEEFKEYLINYMNGINVVDARERLSKIDFTYIAKALNMKISTTSKRQPKNVYKYSDEPMISFTKAIIQFYDILRTKDIEGVNSIKIKILQAGMAQVFTTDEMFNLWNNVCIVTGGLIEAINREQIPINDDDYLSITLDNDYFDFSKATSLVNEGILLKLPSSQSLCKITFVIKDINDKCTQEFMWEFNAKEDWIVLFQDVVDIKEEMGSNEAYIPYGIDSKVSTTLNARNKAEFYGNYSNLNIQYKYDLVELFTDAYGQGYPEYMVKYYKLGRAFTNWINEISEKGIFKTIQNSTYDLLEAYNTYAEYLLAESQTAEFQQSYKLFINAFLISDSDKSIIQDVDVSNVIIPPFHPAVLEKIYYRIDYIKWGLHTILKEFLTGGNAIKLADCMEEIDRLLELSVIDSAIDVLISNNKYIAKKHLYGFYTVYSDENMKNDSTRILTDLMQHDGIYSEDFNNSEYKRITPLAKIIKNNISNYLTVFPIAENSLEVVVINFDDFQDVVSAIHNLIEIKQDDASKLKGITLRILMPIDKQGGQSYLSYWINNFFDEDTDVKIKIYLNYYKKFDEINKMIPSTTDLIFYNDLLKQVNVRFSTTEVRKEDTLIETRFPMVYRTLPVSITSKKRQIEITQTQFRSSTLHSQVIYKLQNMYSFSNKQHIVIKEMEMEEQVDKLLELLHEKSRWVVCIGLGLDKKLLMKNDDITYKIIGFSTGEGTYGEYNVTTSACLSMIDDLKTKLTMKFNRIFVGQDKSIIKAAVEHCINEVSNLDGISILKALNPEDYDINNFLAYLMTNKYFINNRNQNDSINIIVPLDSYKHWFDKSFNKEKEKKNYRPDFLQLKIGNFDEDSNIVIKANVIECKFAKENEEHYEKAVIQVNYGIETLKQVFNPYQQDIERRYWFAQLYKVLTFSEINMYDNDRKFLELSQNLMRILDGMFSIEWSGSVMTYWIDSDINDIESTEISTGYKEVNHITFGQKTILKYLTGQSDLNLEYNSRIMLDYIDEIDDSDEEEEVVEEIKNNNIVAFEYKDKNESIMFVASTGVGEQSIIRDAQELHKTSENVDETKEEIATSQERNHTIVQYNSKNVCLGLSTIQNEEIQWNFTDPQMSNRHILITGKSGQGKTYAIQGMFMELAQQDIPVIIFDYTGGFVENKLEPTLLSRLNGRIHQQIVRVDKLKINPFKVQTLNINDIEIPESSVDVAERFKDILVHVYNFGDQQGAAIYRACKNGLDKHKDKMNFTYFKEELELLGDNGTKEAKSVYNKIISFLDYDIFDTKHDSNWDEIMYKQGDVTVFQLSYVQSRDMQVAITEMILWDMWYYSVKNGKEEKPFAVILDEAQNLSFGDKAPTTKILTEGRKFGWSGWFATQFLKGQLKSEEINRLQQAALRIYFKPADDEIQSMAVSIDPERKNLDRWVKHLTKAQKGECVVTGDGLYGDTSKKNVPITIKVPSIEERK